MAPKSGSRVAASLILVGMGAALAGCGGGMGSGMNFSGSDVSDSSTSGGNSVSQVSNVSSGTKVLLNANFNKFDTDTWGVYGNAHNLQNTYFGLKPKIEKENGLSFLRLRHDTYNPDRDYAGTYTKGTEIYSKQRFKRGDGLEMTARMRVAPGFESNGQPISPGLIFAFFGINVYYVKPLKTQISGAPKDDGYRQTEIDYELLTSEPQYNSGERKRLWTNIWNDWNFYGYGYEAGQPTGYDADNVDDGPERLHDDKVYQPSVNAGFDWAQWNIYTIRWYPDRTEYYVNGSLERTEHEVKPDEPLSVHVDIWAPNFPPASSPNFGPTNNAAQNHRDAIDIDYITVSRLGSTAAAVSEAQEPLSPKDYHRSR